MVGAKVTLTFPSPSGCRPLSDALETANMVSATSRVTEKDALNAGSSQQGKARRAWVDSNWVHARVCSAPPLSVKVDR